MKNSKILTLLGSCFGMVVGMNMAVAQTVTEYPSGLIVIDENSPSSEDVVETPTGQVEAPLYGYSNFRIMPVQTVNQKKFSECRLHGYTYDKLVQKTVKQGGMELKIFNEEESFSLDDQVVYVLPIITTEIVAKTCVVDAQLKVFNSYIMELPDMAARKKIDLTFWEGSYLFYSNAINARTTTAQAFQRLATNLVIDWQKQNHLVAEPTEE